MSKQSLSSHRSLLTANIQPKTVTYYLVTVDNIKSIKSKSLLCDLFMFLASLTWGAYISVITTIKSIATPTSDLDPVYKILLPLLSYQYIFLCAAIIFTIIMLVVFYISFKSLDEVMKSEDLNLNLGDSKVGQTVKE